MVPQDLRYTKEHEWVRMEGEKAVVGITSYAQEQLGDVVYVELPKMGQEVFQLKPFGVVESVKAASDLFSPLSGKVVGTNPELGQHPELVNQDPYGRGWMIKIYPSDPKEMDSLLGPQEYEQHIARAE